MANLLSPFLNFLALFSIAGKRIRHHLGISISSGIGIISVLSLVICVPVFTNAILSEVLQQELTEKALKNRRSLFSMHAYYRDNATYSPLTLANAQAITTWIERQLTEGMGLEVERVYLELTTQALVWKPVAYQSSQPPFVDLQMNFIVSDIVPEKTRLVEGEWPVSGATGGPIPVAVYEDFADKSFLNVGDILRSGNQEIEVVGIFRANDPGDLHWFYRPDMALDKSAWVPAQLFEERLAALLERPARYTSWYAIVADRSVRFNHSLSYYRAMVRLDSGLQALLPQITIDYSPVEQLSSYESRFRSLIVLFYAAGAPLVLLALIFISLTAARAVQQVEQETATLRGRGVSLAQVFTLNFIESLVLIGMAIPGALFLGWLSAMLMGKTQLFLQFTRHSELAFSIRDIQWGWIAGLALLVILARLVPLLSLRHTTAISLKQERSRSSKRPLWERSFIDFLLLIPAGYAFWILRGQAKPMQILTDLQLSGGEGQYDPLMFIASSLFAVAAAMLALRLAALLLRLVAKVSERFFGAGAYLAVQELARRPQEHASVILLIMIALSLAIYSASMAKTLDRWMHDSQYYQTGADLVIKEYEIPRQDPSQVSGVPVAQPAQPDPMKAVESLVSLEKHLDIPGVRSASFVGKYNGRCSYGAGQQECLLMGIDRLNFPATAYYRPDFAGQPLGALMNALGGEPRGVLVPESLLESSGLQIGDRLSVTAHLGILAEGFSEEMVIVGAYTYFPTVYPARAPTLIASLETLFGVPEAVTGYEVWLDLDDQAPAQAVLDNLKALAFQDFFFVDVRGNALGEIQQLTNQPEWVGLFGILSVGFLLTCLMPCVGFVLDTFASLRKNFIQLGILMAIGLSHAQLVSYLALERLMIMGIALAGGALTGFLTSVLFVPLLQVSAAPGTPIPPFEVLLGWAEAGWLIAGFAAVLLVTVMGTIGYLMRIEIFQAVKLGESI